MEKPFWRETNIWRMIGGLLALNGFWALILYPSNIHPDIILYKSDAVLFTIWHLVVVIGLTTAFYPTLKELIIGVIQSWRSK
jgi:hypothetical protein